MTTPFSMGDKEPYHTQTPSKTIDYRKSTEDQETDDSYSYELNPSDDDGTDDDDSDAELPFALQGLTLQQPILPAMVHRPLPQAETDTYHYPRCEYYTRFAGTSLYDIKEEEDIKYAGTYHRSTGSGGGSSRYTQYDQRDGVTFINPTLNKPDGASYHAHTGTFHNPYHFPAYSNRVTKNVADLPPTNIPVLVPDLAHLDLSHTTTTNNIAYEHLLDYRNQICTQVRERTLALLPASATNFQLIHHNDYPYLLIKIPFIEHFKDVESWNQLFIAYYIAIVNKNAKNAGVPIEMVIRSSFGHLAPSIDVTGDTFRINVGIVPALYGQILAQSLEELQKVLRQLEDLTLATYTQNGQSWLANKNQQIQAYNNGKAQDKQLGRWEDHLTCYEILQLKGDTNNGSVAKQVFRNRAARELLADYVAQELDKVKPDFAYPLKEMLNRLTFNGPVSMNIPPNEFQRNSREWEAQENSLLRQDLAFWKLIKQSVDCIGGDATLYTNRQVFGLYAHLEKCNQAFSICSASTLPAADGIGSDSEYEDEELQNNQENRKQPLYYKKMILSTGMMGINVAHYIARDYVKNFLNKQEYRTEFNNMYYETESVLKLSSKNQPQLATLNNHKKKDILTALFFDLNHCDTTGAGSNRLKYYLKKELQAQRVKVVVLDYTSSTRSQIKCAINDARAAGIELILLVNSGLKNEQFGADKNPYGTVRIITNNKNVRDTLYQRAQQAVAAHPFPATAHKIRKGYKKAGMVLTNQLIATADVADEQRTKSSWNISSLFNSMYDITRYKNIILDQIEQLNTKKIQLSSEQKEIIGAARTHDLEQQTIIGHLENTLRELITTRLKEFIEEEIKQAYQQDNRGYEDAYESYQLAKQDYDDGDYDGCDDWDWDGPAAPVAPTYVSLDGIQARYGNLDDLHNLLSYTDNKTLSQILYDDFIGIDGMEDIIEALAPECNTLNVSPQLMRTILEGCDVQFGHNNTLQPGFLLEKLIKNVTQRFDQIVAAYTTGKDDWGRTRLHMAVQRGNLSAVDQLLTGHAIGVNTPDKFGETALHLAAKGGFVDIIDTLLKHQADVNTQCKWGVSPLHQVAYCNKPAVLETIALLCDAGANIHAATTHGSSPLHTATQQNQTEMMIGLIKRGTQVECADKNGWTPLHVAANNGHQQATACLLKFNANIEAVDQQGNTPLHIALSSLRCRPNEQFLGTIPLLVNKKILTLKNKEGHTPIDLAQQQGDQKIIACMNIDKFI